MSDSFLGTSNYIISRYIRHCDCPAYHQRGMKIMQLSPTYSTKILSPYLLDFYFWWRSDTYSHPITCTYGRRSTTVGNVPRNDSEDGTPPVVTGILKTSTRQSGLALFQFTKPSSVYTHVHTLFTPLRIRASLVRLTFSTVLMFSHHNFVHPILVRIIMDRHIRVSFPTCVLIAAHFQLLKQMSHTHAHIFEFVQGWSHEVWLTYTTTRMHMHRCNHTNKQTDRHRIVTLNNSTLSIPP